MRKSIVLTSTESAALNAFVAANPGASERAKEAFIADLRREANLKQFAMDEKYPSLGINISATNEVREMLEQDFTILGVTTNGTVAIESRGDVIGIREASPGTVNVWILKEVTHTPDKSRKPVLKTLSVWGLNIIKGEPQTVAAPIEPALIVWQPPIARGFTEPVVETPVLQAPAPIAAPVITEAPPVAEQVTATEVEPTPIVVEATVPELVEVVTVKYRAPIPTKSTTTSASAPKLVIHQGKYGPVTISKPTIAAEVTTEEEEDIETLSDEINDDANLEDDDSLVPEMITALEKHGFRFGLKKPNTWAELLSRIEASPKWGDRPMRIIEDMVAK